MDDLQNRHRNEWLERFPVLADAVARLRPAARQRFMMQLRFDGDALAGFSLDELRAVLPAQTRQALLRDILVSVTPPDFHMTLERHLESLPRDADLHVSSNMMFGTGRATRESRHALNIDGIDAEPFDTPTLRKLHKENLLIVFNALCTMEPDCVFTGRDRRPLLSNAIQALEQRRMATPWRLRQAQAALIRNGCYAQARQLSARHSGAQLPGIPYMRSTWHEGQGPSAWRPMLRDDPPALQREALDLSTKRWWIASPITFSAQAEALALMLHQCHWQVALETFGGWLTQPTGCEPIDALPAWNLRYPRTPAWPVAEYRDWPFPHWVTPILFVVEAGQVIEHMQGWNDPAATLTGLLQRHQLV